MKKIILLLILLKASTVYAILGIGEGEPIKCPEPPKTCYYSIFVTGDDTAKVFYVFEGLCGGITQVGVIDEINRHIIEIKNLRQQSKTEYSTPAIGSKKVKEFWGEVTPILFYQQ